MRKTKTQKGITLVALIITIVVLLILAAVAIAAIQDTDIIAYSNNAATKYNQAQANEQGTLSGYDGVLGQYGGDSVGDTGGGSTGSQTKTVEEVKNVKQTSNTKVVDEYGNQIVIPAGFKIRVDEGTRTKGDEKSTATHVTEGIVIEDASGNQFVWVPVGNIKTSKTDTVGTQITLGRYSSFVATNGVYTPATTIENTQYTWTEEAATSTGLGQYGNALARNIEDFKTSATQNKGYYIGRYEAGNASNTLVCKTGQTVYKDITQTNASNACKGMYNNGADGYKANTFSSDLINSYAWDTAIIFIQTFGGTAASNYSSQNNSDEYTTTGGNGDEYCNINDMSGNALEWSTEIWEEEFMGNYIGGSVMRGGCYNAGMDLRPGSTNYRTNADSSSTTGNLASYDPLSFRPLLYVAL